MNKEKMINFIVIYILLPFAIGNVVSLNIFLRIGLIIAISLYFKNHVLDLWYRLKRTDFLKLAINSAASFAFSFYIYSFIIGGFSISNGLNYLLLIILILFNKYLIKFMIIRFFS